MYNQPVARQSKPIYHLDPVLHESLKTMKNHIHGLCAECINRPVRVQTIHGHVYEGHIVRFDDTHLYLQTAPGYCRAFLNPGLYYNNVILPLVLYELLVISLMST